MNFLLLTFVTVLLAFNLLNLPAPVQLGKTNASQSPSSPQPEFITPQYLEPPVVTKPELKPSVASEYSKQNSDYSTWQYPNSTVLETSGTFVTYQSFDDPTLITNWYKTKIQGNGMNTTSFIVTKTNDNISNKLIGDSSEKHVNVEIQKSPKNSQTEIRLSFN